MGDYDTGDEAAASDMPYGASLGRALATTAGLPLAAVKAVVGAGQKLGILPGQAQAAPAPAPAPAPAADESAGISLARIPAPAAPAPISAPPAGRTRAAPPVAVANSTPPTDRDADGERIEPPQGAPGEEPHPVAQALQAQGVNPAIAAYLADKAARQDELKGAQAKASRDLALAVGVNAGSNAIQRGYGKAGSDLSQAEVDLANKPVSDVLARQKAGDEALGEAGKLQAFETAAKSNDPNDPTNVAMRDFYAKMGIKLPPGLTTAQGGPLVENFLKQQKDTTDTQTRLQIERESRASAEGIAARHESGENYRAGQKFQIERNTKPLPPAATKEAEDALEVLETTPELRAKQKDVGVVTGALGKLGLHVGAEGEYNDAAKASAGTIARTEFQGSRGPSGAKQVMNTLPTGLTPEGRAGKQYDNIDRIALNRAEAKIAALKSAHPDHPQIAELETRLAKAKQGAVPAASGGRVVVSPSGSRHPLAPGAAVPQGWRLE